MHFLYFRLTSERKQPYRPLHNTHTPSFLLNSFIRHLTHDDFEISSAFYHAQPMNLTIQSNLNRVCVEL